MDPALRKKMLLLHGFTESIQSVRAVSDFFSTKECAVTWLARDRFRIQITRSGFNGQIKSYEDFTDAKRVRHSRVIDAEVRRTGAFNGELDVRSFHNSLCLMEREGKSRSVYELLARLQVVLGRVQHFLDQSPDLLAFVISDTPHSVVTYIMWRECQRRSIPCVVLRQGPLPHQFCFATAFDSPLVDELRNERLPVMHPATELWLTMQGSGVGSPDPAYMLREKDRARLRSVATRGVKTIRPSNVGSSIRTLQSLSKRALLKREYEMQANKWVEGDGTCVFFLHFQPERTSIPDAGLYGDLAAATRMVRRVLNDNVGLMVREHPSTFLSTVQNVRSVEFYRCLADMSEGEFLSVTVNRNQVFDSCVAVATLTGTVGIEAAARGIPVGYLGNAPYAGCPGTVDLRRLGPGEWMPERSREDNTCPPSEVGSFLARFDSAQNTWTPTEPRSFSEPRLDKDYYRGVLSGLVGLVDRLCS